MEKKYAEIAGKERGEFISPFRLKAGMLRNERIHSVRSPPPGNVNVCADGKYRGLNWFGGLLFCQQEASRREAPSHPE